MTDGQRVRLLVDQVDAGLTGLADLLSDPSSVSFLEVQEEFVRLEKIIGSKAFIDAAFAWLVERSDAGRLVGSTRPTDFLIKAMGLSRRESLDRLGRGEDLFTPPTAEPMPAPAPEPGESGRELREREEKIRAEERRRHERDLAAQETARQKARRQASTEKQQIIRQELRRLNQHSTPSYAQLHADALGEADSRDPDDLRVWLRHRVNNANAAGRQPDGKKDRLAGQKKRFLHLGGQDPDGNVRVTGSLPAYVAAKLAAALAPGLRPGVNADVPEEQDKRPRGARSVDQLDTILGRFLAAEASTTRQGVGSIVVSMVADDIAEMTVDSRYLSNTGHLLTPLDILNLGSAKFDIGMVHDASGKPLILGRHHRSASMFQKIALLALEGVCACGSCDGAMIHAHVHHIDPWHKGGLTNIENLTLMCPPHHGDNNDARDGAGGMGHMERDAHSGRAGWRPPDGGALHFNDTMMQEYSAGAKIRARHRPPRMRDTPPGDPPSGDSPSGEELQLFR